VVKYLNFSSFQLYSARTPEALLHCCWVAIGQGGVMLLDVMYELGVPTEPAWVWNVSISAVWLVKSTSGRHTLAASHYFHREHPHLPWLSLTGLRLTADKFDQ
jgi:hypothetical protein